MKIGIVVPGFSADERDWCIPALYNFVRTLASSNNVHVFAIEYPYRRDCYSFFGATVHAMNGRHRGKLYAPRLWTETITAIRAEHARGRFDILHAFWVNEAGWIAWMASRLTRVPLIASVAGGELIALRDIDYGGQLNWIERTLIAHVMSKADCVTVGSRYLRGIARKWRTDAQIAPLGVNTKMFAPGGLHQSAVSPRHSVIEHSHYKILNVASLLPVKAHKDLLNAIVQMPDACLEIVGEGVTRKELGKLAENLAITSRVQFTGALPHDALAEKYRAADLVVQSSFHEAQGVAILEAAACGAAITGTPVGVLPELAESGGARMTQMDSGHWNVNGRRLLTAIETARESREQMRGRAREIVEQEFSLDAVKEKWMRLYESTANHKA